jgi:hypothetical protein
MSTQKLTVIDPVAGFTERDPNSKAILNTDMDSLLKHKIQRRRFSEINRNSKEIVNVKEKSMTLEMTLVKLNSYFYK